MLPTEKPYLSRLNAHQRQAVLATSGPLLILAGAGAGKTNTVTHRILHLIHEGVNPSAILAITFTNKAAKEMRDRLNRLLENDASLNRPISMFERPFVSTFHSLGVHILKENSKVLGIPRHFTIFDRQDSVSAVKEAVKESNLDPKQYEPGKLLSLISRKKGEGLSLSMYQEKARQAYFRDYIEQVLVTVWEKYEAKLQHEKALDFDDLLLKTLLLLRDNPEILRHYQDTWKYIHIDEYQDTNRVQYDMAKLLASRDKNICVVGDIDQCLTRDTKVQMADTSVRSISTIRKGEKVLSCYGSGDIRPSVVAKTFSKKFSGELIRIKTKSGSTLTSTPHHMHFAGYKLGTSSQQYFTYLMYKQSVGYRLGTSQVYTQGQKLPMVGFMQRCNQEHGDAVWVVGVHPTPNDAKIMEYTLSLRYSIPTLPFLARKSSGTNGYIHDQKLIDKIFKSFDTHKAGERLLDEVGLSFAYPHHRPRSRNSNRRNIVVTLCGDRRGSSAFHRISIVGNDQEGAGKLAQLGLSVREAKKNSGGWRVETGRIHYGELLHIVEQIRTAFPDSTVITVARLGKKIDGEENSLAFLPAASVLPGMVMFGERGNLEIVETVEREEVKNMPVYDLDISGTHNFVANGIFTHNSIYSWRGADFKNIMRFEKDYADATVILLEENYRSTKTILQAANTVISKNTLRKEKNLYTSNGDGEKISLYGGFSEEDEARFIVGKARELIGGGLAPREIAVLYRANFQSRVLEEAFLMAGVPYQVLGVRFFERKEVKDVLSYLRAALNEDSLSDIKRVINTPARGLGKTTVAKLFSGQKDSLPASAKQKIASFRELLEKIKKSALAQKPSDTISYIILESGLKDEYDKADATDEDRERLENMFELVTLATKYDLLSPEEGIEKLLADAALASDQDEMDKDQNAVKLMTVHAAKGLEFDAVFVTGLEEDLFPHTRMNGKESLESTEEERRLFYVALTRARKKLFLTFAAVRTIFGSKQINVPSSFLEDIDEDLLEAEEREGVTTVYLD